MEANDLIKKKQQKTELMEKASKLYVWEVKGYKLKPNF